MKRTIITIAAVAIVVVPVVQAQPAPDTLSIAAAPGTVKFGGSITLSGKLTGSNVEGRNVRVQADEFPLDSFSNEGNATTNATGDWSLVVRPNANTRYRARVGNLDSAGVDITVMPRVSLRLSDRTPARGQRVRFSGRVCPAHDTVEIALQRRSSTGWRTIASPALADIPNVDCSSYSVVKRPRRNGRFRARFLGDTDHAASNSRVRRAVVH
jgi:hypothetical protein